MGVDDTVGSVVMAGLQQPLLVAVSVNHSSRGYERCPGRDIRYFWVSMSGQPADTPSSRLPSRLNRCRCDGIGPVPLSEGDNSVGPRCLDHGLERLTSPTSIGTADSTVTSRADGLALVEGRLLQRALGKPDWDVLSHQEPGAGKRPSAPWSQTHQGNIGCWLEGCILW